MNQKILNLTQLAQHIGVPKRTIHDQLKKDRFPIPSLPNTRPRKWAVADVDAWLESNRDTTN